MGLVWWKLSSMGRSLQRPQKGGGETQPRSILRVGVHSACQCPPQFLYLLLRGGSASLGTTVDAYDKLSDPDWSFSEGGAEQIELGREFEGAELAEFRGDTRDSASLVLRRVGRGPKLRLMLANQAGPGGE